MLDPSYDSYGAVVALAGGVPRPIPLQPPDWRVDAEAVGAGGGGAHARAAGELAAQPHRARAGRRGARPARRRLPPARRDRAHRRGLRAPDLRRRAHPALHAAGHGGAHDHGVVARQELRVHRLEDRLGDRSGRAGRGRARRQAVPDLRRRHAAAARGRARRSNTRPTSRRALAASLAVKRDLLAAGLAEAGFDVLHTSGTYFLTADARPLGFDDAVALCERLPLEAGRGGDPDCPRSPPTRSTAPARWSASRSARSATCWRTRWGGWWRGGLGPRSRTRRRHESARRAPFLASVLLSQPYALSKQDASEKQCFSDRLIDAVSVLLRPA